MSDEKMAILDYLFTKDAFLEFLANHLENARCDEFEDWYTHAKETLKEQN
jgi:hypothetical protein